MKRILPLFLLFAMLVSCLSLFACKTPELEGGGGGGGLVEVDFLDRLDDYGDSLDFSDQGEFIISFAEQFKHEVYGEEGSTDKLDTLIYNRNRLLESRFGLKISTEYGMPDTGGVAHYEYVQLHLNSGDVTFDVAALNAYQAGKLILGNGANFLDLRSEVPYVRDSITAGEEWWPSDINLDATVMGHQYIGVSDFSITAIEMAFAVIFNRDLAKSTNVVQGIAPEKYTLDATFYDVVRNNDWTLDTFTTIVKSFYRDNPNEGFRGECDAVDRFGMVAPAYTDVDAWCYAFGYTLVKNDGVTAPELWDWDGSQYDAIEDLRTLYAANGSFTDEGLRHLGMRAEFFAQQDRALFMLNTLGSLKYDVIHNMEQDFGVLPYPKYKKEQEHFLTGSLDNYSAIGVPFTLLWNEQRLRMTGALIEALAAENCNSVKKPFYDEIVTHHNVTDGDSAEMIDLIIKGRVYDLSMYHHNELVMDTTAGEHGAFALFFRYLVENPHKDIIQYWQSNAISLGNQMDDLVEEYNRIFS